MKQDIYSPTTSFFDALIPRCEYTGNRLSTFTRTVKCTLALWRERSASRQQLSRLDDRMLNDIGLSYHEVHEEVSKPFWSE